jgi:hypothetical protein
MRLPAISTLAFSVCALTACTGPLARPRHSAMSVYDHVSCNTPGARREEPIPSNAAESESTPVKADPNKSRTITCVIEHRPG